MARALFLVLLFCTVLPHASLAQSCLGDCNGDGRVAVDELVIGVNVALARAELSACPAFDNGSGIVSVDVLVTAVRNALEGCPPTPTVTPTVTSTTTATADATATPTTTATSDATATASADATETPTATATVEATDTATATPSQTPTDTSGATPTDTPTATQIPTASATATSTESAGIFQGALVPTNGRFTFQAIVGIEGAHAECDTQFPGSHACTVDELRDAETAGELAGATDTDGTPVTSFWAIDPSRPAVDQCTVTMAWDYATAHTGQFADLVNLDNGSGALSALQQDTICATQHWVGCCL